MNMIDSSDDTRHWGPVIRTADRMRLEGCINALTREGLNLSLQCANEALLDHYVRLLLTRLRESQVQHQIDVYFPANTESLLDRFNAVLADQTLGDATQNPQVELPVRVWVVHDAQKVPESEMQLLARLIQNFPGARIRVLMLFHGIDTEPSTLSAFGRKLLRWDIDLPTPEQAIDALELASGEGRQAQMSQLLRRIGRLPVATTPLSLGQEALVAAQEEHTRAQRIQTNVSPQPAWPARGQWAQWAWSRLRDGVSGLQQVRTSRVWTQTAATRKLVLGAGAALVLTLILMAWIQPQGFTGKKKTNPPAPVQQESPAKEPSGERSTPEQKQGPVGLWRNAGPSSS